MKLLLTAFTPFDGEDINPALEAMKLVKNKIENLEIIKLEVPTVFGESIQLVVDVIDEVKPDFVLCVGQAGGRAEICPERVAINIDDAEIPDNEGNQPIDETIFMYGDKAYFSTLPIKAMVEEIKKEGIPSTVSNSAGTYVCNHLMYGVLYFLDSKDKWKKNRNPFFENIGYNNSGLGYPDKEKVTKAGFIHVPYIPEQTKDKKDMPSLPLSDIVRGLEAAIKAIFENEIALRKTDKDGEENA